MLLQVCVNQCNQDEHYCEPLQSWALRLDTDLVTHADYIRKVEPGVQPWGLRCLSTRP